MRKINKKSHSKFKKSQKKFLIHKSKLISKGLKKKTKQNLKMIFIG